MEQKTDSTKILLSSSISVGQDEQYTISTAFSYKAKSAYSGDMHWYRWDTTWPNPDEELYYRVGAGPWTRVNGRTVVHADSVYHGALEFYILIVVLGLKKFRKVTPKRANFWG